MTTITTIQPHITRESSEQIAEELKRSANIIASYYDANRKDMPANVACALTREMERLRNLASIVCPPRQVEPEE